MWIHQAIGVPDTELTRNTRPVHFGARKAAIVAAITMFQSDRIAVADGVRRRRPEGDATHASGLSEKGPRVPPAGGPRQGSRHQRSISRRARNNTPACRLNASVPSLSTRARARRVVQGSRMAIHPEQPYLPLPEYAPTAEYVYFSKCPRPRFLTIRCIDFGCRSSRRAASL